ncbi:cryptochrome/photolyase family protein [Glaciecola sp. 1036]|uniref:cryptochrome/photolyase family protein n=1 Tax=Alteromonadaceae TaxID=72275 RepID=UPI003D04CA8C
MANTIVWFRQDLRLNDNPALAAACEKGSVIPVFIYDETLDEKYQPGGASKWWLHHALMDLSSSLDNKLIVKKGKPKEILGDLIEQFDAKYLCWNRMYEPWARSRDQEIKEHFKEQGVVVASFNGSLLWEPMEVKNQSGEPYKVYTPYYRKGCLNQPSPRYPLERVKPKISEGLDVNSQKQIEELELLPTISWDEEIAKQWTASERAAGQNLQIFIKNAITDYADDRNIPSIKGTSRLSPYLHFGQISPNQVWYAIHEAFHGNTSGKGVDTYLSEIGWREFSYYLLYHFPDIGEKNYNQKFDKFPWRTNQIELEAWQTGNTGVPIVDAGMRELWKTGYMHNRVRMVVGSYLVKNLLLDWRQGERWFWDCLLDADSASNAASWQWVAGSGADAAPYFRVFNPVLQGEKFDKEGEYVKQYCPELSKLPKKYIHKPWEAPPEVLQDAGIELGKDYPKPLVDLKDSRNRALDAFNQIKG